MSIPAVCSCGKKLRVKDELAGKRIKCPACGQAITAPMADGGTEETYGLGQGEPENPKKEGGRAASKRSAGATAPQEFDHFGQPRPAKKRKPTGASTGRMLLAVPLFALAILSACATGWFSVIPLVFHWIGIVTKSSNGEENKAMFFGILIVGGVITQALFWVASSVKQGRFVPLGEFFNLKKGD